MILPKASSTLDKIASSQALFSIWCTTAGGSLPPIGFCPTGNTPLPPLRALNRRARNALAHTPPILEPFTHRTHSPLNSPTAPPLDYHSYSSLFFYLKYSLRHRPWGFVDNLKIAQIKSHSQTKRMWANCGRFVDACG